MRWEAGTFRSATRIGVGPVYRENGFTGPTGLRTTVDRRLIGLSFCAGRLGGFWITWGRPPRWVGWQSAGYTERGW